MQDMFSNKEDGTSYKYDYSRFVNGFEERRLRVTKNPFLVTLKRLSDSVSSRKSGAEVIVENVLRRYAETVKQAYH